MIECLLFGIIAVVFLTYKLAPGILVLWMVWKLIKKCYSKFKRQRIEVKTENVIRLKDWRLRK